MPALPLGFPGKGEHGGEPPHSEIKSEYKFKERIFELCNFWMAQQSPWLVLTRYIHSAPILVANLLMSPRDKMNSLRPNFFLRPAEMSDSTEFSYHFFVFSSQQPPSRERSCRGAFMWRMPRKVSCLGVSIA
jgi:hypothetical protein